MADSKKNIYETIIAVMGEIGAIGKEKKNIQQNFMYRGIDDVMNALNPSFIKHKLFMVPEVLEQRREERQTAKGGNLIYSVCRVRYTFYAEDGSTINAEVVGEAMDSGDKASNKAMAAAFKYACFQVFCIPTEEMKDPDADTNEPSKKKPERITDTMKKTFASECERIGKTQKAILAYLRIESLEVMTVEQFKTAMELFKQTPDKTGKQPDPKTIPPEEPDCGLPFNTPER